MSDEEFLESIVSDEEIQALLRSPAEPETGGDSTPESPNELFAVVLASRRGDDATLLSRRLSAHGVHVDRVRNVFGALDRLRTRRYVAILSDFELWADRGRLLFERLTTIEEPPLVVFLMERTTTGEDIIPSGVAGKLLCPLASRDVEDAVEQIVAVARQFGVALGCAAHESGALRTEVAAGGKPELPAPAMDNIERTAARRGELPWLRFFLEAQRLARSGPPDEVLTAGLVRLACEVLGADGAGIVVVTSSGRRASLNAGPGMCRLAEIAAVLDSEPTEPIASSPDYLVLALDGAGGVGSRLILRGVPRPIWTAWPAFRDDVRHLVATAIR